VILVARKADASRRIQTKSFKNAAVATMQNGKDIARQAYTQETDELAPENCAATREGNWCICAGKQSYGVVVPPERRVFGWEHD